MTAVLAIASSFARDCSRRGSLILVLCMGCALMLMLRYFCVFALGEELFLLRELGIANLVLGGAIAAILCAVPVERSALVLAADRVLLSRPISAISLPLGRWLGSAAILLGLYLVWFTFLWLALVWFSEAEPNLFTMQRSTTPGQEILSLAVPALLVLAQSIMLCGIALLAGAGGSILAASITVLGLLVGLILLPNVAHADDAPVLLRALGWLLPDLRLYSPSETLYGAAPDFRWVAGGILQALGYGAAATLVASFRMSR